MVLAFGFNEFLQNPYLLHEIFEWLQWTFNSTETSTLRLSYYNAALVCRSFRGPAQTLLWRHLDSVFPLLYLLPTFKQDTGLHGPCWDLSLFLQQRSRSSPHLLTRLSIALANDTILDLIPSFQNLTWLQFQTDYEAVVDIDLLVALAKMENLSYLCLKTHDLNMTPEDPPRRLRFEKLKTLVLSCPFEQGPEFFGAVDLPVLYQVSYHFGLPLSPHRYTFAWADLFNAIAGATPPSVLQELTLRPARWGIPLSSSHTTHNKFTFYYPGVPFDSISTSLLRFQLTALSLDFPLLSSLSNDDLQFIIGAWPSLRLLRLRCATETTVDLGALITIAAFLPMLENLTIDVNLNQLNTVGLEPLQTLITHGLLHLTLRVFGTGSCHRKLNAMAFLLNSLFPYLRTVETVIGFEECDMTLSEQVKTLQTAGLYERRRFGIEGPFGPLVAEFTDDEDVGEEEREANNDWEEW
ncbi:hypothetical protein BJ165DRAFT_1405342 [Panaeolus papilionaceus]|nr:hypothetical protein BJ165DRAFT_1405342 [Panaeolus papilionaceus]